MIDIEKPRETFRRLAAIAVNAAATDAERETARSMMARYIEKYGDEVRIPEEEATIERDVPYAHPYEYRLALHCGVFMGVKVMDLGDYKYKGTKREKFVSAGKERRYRGPESAVLGAVELYEHHRQGLEALLTATENGYRHGAMPLPQAFKDKHRSDKEPEPLPPEVLATARAAAKAGAANVRTKRLGRGG